MGTCKTIEPKAKTVSERGLSSKNSLRLIRKKQDVYSIGTPTVIFQCTGKVKTSLGVWKQRWFRVSIIGIFSFDDEHADYPKDFLSSAAIENVTVHKKGEVRVDIRAGVEDFKFDRIRLMHEEDIPCLMRALQVTLTRRSASLIDLIERRVMEGIIVKELNHSKTSSLKAFNEEENSENGPFVWQWQDNHGLWRVFPSIVTPTLHKIETSSKKTGELVLDKVFKTCRLDLNKRELRSSGLGRIYQLRRAVPSVHSISSTSSSSPEQQRSPDNPRRRTNSRLKQLVEISAFCANIREAFMDTSFPPNDTSLYSNGEQLQGEWECGRCASKNKKGTSVCWSCQAQRIIVTGWLRPVQVEAKQQRIAESSEKPWSVFDEGPCPHDIQQGALGNCWFLSALAVLAERPELLKALYLNTSFNPSGAYLIKLCKDGLWKYIIIDDFLPCAQNKRIAYAQPKRKQLWVPLIEKALAKCYGSYESIASGQIYDGLSILTGMPVEKIDLRPPSSRSRERRATREDATSALGMLGYEDEELDGDILWIRLLSFREARWLMGASCGIYDTDDAEDMHKAVGLQKFHAYSVLDVREIASFRLIKLRNPWGAGEKGKWLGDWSAASSCWTTELRTLLCPNGEEPGAFWMSFSDLRKYFGRIDVCKIRPTWITSPRFKGTFSTSTHTPCKYFELSVQEGSVQVEVTLQQPSDRGFKNPSSAPPLVDMGLCILKELDNGCYELVLDTRRVPMIFVNLEAFLEAGEKYIVVPLGFNKIHHDEEIKPDYPYTLVVHSSKIVMISEKSCDQALFSQVLALRAKKHGEVKRVFDHQYVYTQSHDAGAIVMVENRHPTSSFHIEMDNSNSFNVCSTRGELKTVDVIPPNHYQIIQVLSQIVDDGYSWSSKLRYIGNCRDEIHLPPVHAPGLHAPQRFTPI